ncbi:hypothetical protein B0H10DRAFT_2198009 [Mycena sp. CBHHK59/15]|nr:hypothetical protein B0H10DRAFT_2198009 [Mycena sp. CBHHK59/15]
MRTQPRNSPLARINDAGDLWGRIGGTGWAQGWHTRTGTALTSVDSATKLELAQGDMNKVWNFMRGNVTRYSFPSLFPDHHATPTIDQPTACKARAQYQAPLLAASATTSFLPFIQIVQCYPPTNTMPPADKQDNKRKKERGKDGKDQCSSLSLVAHHSLHHPPTAHFPVPLHLPMHTHRTRAPRPRGSSPPGQVTHRLIFTDSKFGFSIHGFLVQDGQYTAALKLLSTTLQL